MGTLGSSLAAALLFCFAGLLQAGDAAPDRGARAATHRHGHADDHAPDGHSHAPHTANSFGPKSPGANSRGAKSVDGPDGGPPRRWAAILLGLYCVAIVGASLLGGWLPHLVELSHTRMQFVISAIGGFMLGIGVFHMLPHALVELGDDGPDLAAYGLMAGLLVMFLLLRLFHFHHHGPTEVACAHLPAGGGHEHSHGTVDAPAASSAAASHGRSLSWVGVFLGMGLHTLIDGLALGASVAADALHGAAGLLGFGIFLAVVLHKPLDSVSITSVMAASGWSSAARTAVNAGFSLICPLGAALFFAGVDEFSGRQSLIVGCALAVSAGVFLCIALSDLLPEMEFHSHNRLQLTAALLAGVALAWGIRFVEPAHAHSHRHAEPAATAAR